MPHLPFDKRTLRLAALAAVSLFVIWNGAAMAPAVARLSRTKAASPVADKLQTLAAALEAELSRQEKISEFSEGAQASIERVDQLMALWDRLSAGLTKAPGPEAASGMRRASDFMAAVAVGRIRLAEPMDAGMRRLVEAQVRADAAQALVEVRLAHSQLRNPRREELEAEQHNRLADRLLSLVFGAGVLTVGLYLHFRRTAAAAPLPARSPTVESEVNGKAEAPRTALQARLPDVARDAPVPLVVFDGGGRVTQANRAFEELTGFAAGELGGQPYWETVLAPESVEAARAEFEHSKVEGDTAQVWRVRTGEALRLTWTRSALRDDHGRLDRVIAAGALEKSHAKAAAQPGSIPRRLAESVAQSFSHHLTAINGYSDLVLQSLPAHDPNRDDVEEIRRAGERAAALAGQLQYFSGRDGNPVKRRIDLNTFVPGLERRLRSLLHSDVTLRFKTDENTGEVEGDEPQLEQAVVSLVLNAQDAMPHGGELTIQTAPAWWQDSGWWSTIAVIDTGRGIDPAAREHLFEPFFSTKATGRGTGLGLTVVNEIVRRHGGSIDAATVTGQGSTFRIYLPRADESKLPPPQPAPEQVEA